MNPMMMKMMESMSKMKAGMEKVSVEGRAGNAVHVKFRKRSDLTTELYHISIDPSVIRNQPDRTDILESLVKEAINDALSKEVSELQKAMPADALKDLMK
eukprot:TRINITY_DN15809_c0_g1_i1.p1 TRINITY_DN15809_c0_g1~~TRINITY_DN15809_c0_g1_i1.p1  ORF type:complete len:100 (-),score=27.16 TRINITY_DN15809_c0_g1_i1:20-319(-)